MTDKILITGGCGFIGTSLIKALIQEQMYSSLVVLDNYSEGTPGDLADVCDYTLAKPGDIKGDKGVKLVEGDICDFEKVLRVTKNIDTIIHLAANTGVAPSVENPRMDMENNVIGTFNLLEAARINGVKKFIFASSGAPAGCVIPPIHEELPPHPVSPYGASKLAGEGYCSAYSHSFGIQTVCLRFGNVYGPRSKNKSSVVAKFIRQAMLGKACRIYGDGKQTRDFIYIDDLVSAILLSVKKELTCETFQIACGRERTVAEIALLIRDILQTKEIEMSIVYDSPRVGDVARNYSDTRKAREILNWEAEMDLDQGIKKTVEYFINLTPEGGK